MRSRYAVLPALTPCPILPQLLTSSSGKRRDKREDDEALLTRIQEANPQAGFQFLEHLILAKRSTVSSPKLHQVLAHQAVVHLSSQPICRILCARSHSILPARICFQTLASKNRILFWVQIQRIILVQLRRDHAQLRTQEPPTQDGIVFASVVFV